MNNVELTILSLVAEGPCHGYEIQRLIEDRELRDWLTIGSSSIYYVLNKLEGQGMLASELHESDSGPARKVYRVTEAGRGLLQTAIADLLRQPYALGSGFELGLANLSALGPTQTYLALVQRETDLKQQLETVQQSWKRHQADDDTLMDDTRALYTHALAIMQAELKWLSDFIKNWQQRYPAVTAKKESRDAKPDRKDPRQLQRVKRPSPPVE